VACQHRVKAQIHQKTALPFGMRLGSFCFGFTGIFDDLLQHDSNPVNLFQDTLTPMNHSNGGDEKKYK